MLIDEVASLALESGMWFFVNDEADVTRCGARHLIGFAPQHKSGIGKRSRFDFDVERFALTNNFIPSACRALFACKMSHTNQCVNGCASERNFAHILLNERLCNDQGVDAIKTHQLQWSFLPPRMHDTPAGLVAA